MFYPGPIERLIENLTKLPGIGRKTATRLTFFLLNSKGGYISELSESLVDVKEKIKLCSVCFNITDVDPCIICTDPRRDGSIVCVVEEASHMMVVESANPGRYKYHILHGVINPIEGIGPDEVRIKELYDRIVREGIKEVIIATNPNMEGNTTAHYISEILKPLEVKITRIASGIPIGGDIIYIDPLTIKSSIDNRKNL
ncbi:MAG TPA: recombination mediator RecR [Syntrophorhabdaceae bacterium]|nr:recombination protein RecR [Syntrophorhabdaceae bacterium]MDI9559897.1 recombination mediator RecR [Pseudomonadota bacterium]OQC51465.1 MAG: Recombination protein RecR [Deltaproteobacteria bacterium ADurb.Bin026]MBP8698738.1 recombination protein RecR [Syntrophorhabdaceae bacterium]HNZ58704.1 recombination mediator RecR [Syntrophorhabdaceae bacterium]